MRLDVLDETKSEPTPIGLAEIDCAITFHQDNLKDGKYIHDSWYDLTLNERQAGKIFLEMTFYPSAPVLPPKVKPQSELVMQSAPASPPSTAVDDIFVGAEHKRSSFFRSSDPGHSPLKSPERSPSPLHDVFSESKKQNRFLKLKSKFKAKESIANLWSSELRLSAHSVTDNQQLSPSLSPIDNLEQLEYDIGAYAPPPPPHSHSGSVSEYLSGYYSSDNGANMPAKAANYSSPNPPLPAKDSPRSPKKAARKPPPSGDLGLDKLKLNNTAVPFSADTFGLDDTDDLPTLVYHMDKPVKSLTYAETDKPHRMNPNEIDPRYYAPTPSEHLAKSYRLQSGHIQAKDVKVDLNTQTTGYLGEGKWAVDKRFSPSVFERIGEDIENKPMVPPKIPQGLTEMEYYVLEKDKYLKDLNGRRS